MKKISTTIVASSLLAVAGLGVASANAQLVEQFNYTNFNNASTLQLNGAAAQGPGLAGEQQTISLTPPASHVAGSFFNTTRQSVNLGFVTDFQMRMRDRTGLGADGITFTIQNQGTTALGGTGGALGFGTNASPFVPVQTHTGITNSVSILFDCWNNSGDWNTIPGGQVISVQTNGLGANMPESQFALGGTSITGIFNDATVKNVRIAYTPGTLSIFYQNLATPALTVPLDLENTLGLTAGGAFIGFTGATGGETNVQRHEVLNWKFSSIVPAPSSVALLGLGGLVAARRRRNVA